MDAGPTGQATVDVAWTQRPPPGEALKETGTIQDGALLIRNGVIEEVGTTRRVENLVQARKARTIDAAGRVVMPAFVDPDAVLAYPQPSGMNSRTDRKEEARIGVLSKERLAIAATDAATEWVRAGALTLGAHTRHAADLRDTVRVLRLHQTLQGKPLRIRSIFSPITTDDEKAREALFANRTEKWLASIRQRKLATIVEFSTGRSLDTERIRMAAIAAAELGYATRVRTDTSNDSPELELAVATGAVSVIAPPNEPGEALRLLATMGCVHVLPMTWSLRESNWGEGVVRREIEQGIPVALASGFRPGGPRVINPQHIVHLAVERFGMSVEEAIVAVTYNAACALRMSHVTGSLEPGKSADLLVMDVPDYRDLPARVGSNDVQLAMRAGNVVYRRAGLTID